MKIKYLFALAFVFSILINSCKKEETVDPCTEIQCFNGGICIDGNCDCPEGFTGNNCEIQIDPCANITCLNGGICINGECECPPGYTGPSCGNQITPSRIKVDRILVTKFPATEENGAGWDVLSGPDIYIVIQYNNETIYEHPTFAQNADPSSSYIFEPSINLSFNSPTDQYAIILYDYDDFDPDDFMGGLIFIPYQDGNSFPETLIIQAESSEVAFEIDVDYVF